MPEDLKLSQIGSSQLPPPFRGLHSPGLRKHCQIIFACYFRKSSIRKQPATEVTTKTKNSKDCANTSHCYSFRSVAQLTSNTEPVVN